ELAAQVCEHQTGWKANSSLERAPIPDVWQFATPNRRVVALMLPDKLASRLETIASSASIGPDAKLTLEPPGTENTATFVSLAAGNRLPGWRLAVSFRDRGRL